MLADDGGSGTLREERGGGVVISFPGIRARVADLPAFWQSGELRGQLVRLLGEDETKHGRILSASETRRFECSEAVARELRHHLWDYVRIWGRGRWRRTGDGTWLLLDFRATDFEQIKNDDIATITARLRERGGFGITADGAAELKDLREA